ncbi:MAG: translational GTPase TypA [Candidatus Cloacimonetes bacterium]|nr:translational GTPase TypA [Candidatus Cloacimonadota bacterium]
MKIKNIAIIAHVDHGKTTLVDSALRQAGVFRLNQVVNERVMDSNDLERERGITIFSKNASFHYKDYKINIVDTPGHADFGGEVQRILKMVDSVLLLVDAFEGPMPQTKYVLKKSLELGLRPIVVINKVDRPNARPTEVLELVFDLFIELNAKEEQLDFSVVYASGKDGYAMYELDQQNDNLIPLFETILSKAPDAKGDIEKPLQMLISAIEYNDYLGKIGTGKIKNGKVQQGEEVVLLKRDGERLLYRITRIFEYDGLSKKETKIAYAGDIVSLAGMEKVDVGETVADKEYPEPLPLIEIDEPTLSMTFKVNDSPFAGREGKYVTSRNIWDRLLKELQTNVSIKAELTDQPDEFLVKGRGELQLSVLIENMRRENYEFQVSKPQVIYRELDGKRTEPIELVMIDVADEHAGTVIEMLGTRKGEMLDMVSGNDGYTRLEYKVPARSLLGFRNELLTETRGTAIMNQTFYEYEYYKGEIDTKKRGALISMEEGIATAYSLHSFQPRGTMFIDSGVQVYPGMIIGEHTRENDLVLNVCKGKKLTNFRSAVADESLKLTPPRVFTLELALEYLGDDELLEVTPNSIRMRKMKVSLSKSNNDQ